MATRTPQQGQPGSYSGPPQLTNEQFFAGWQVVLDALGTVNFTARYDFDIDSHARQGAHLHPPDPTLWKNMVPTILDAQDARSYFMRPIRVNSHYRSPEYNRAVGGANASQHLRFAALDLQLVGASQRLLADYFAARDASTQANRGIGLYRTHVHLDTRLTTSARWAGPGVPRWWE